MGMVVRNNLMALNANRQLGSNTNAVQKSLEKLSSGFKINRAGDDASGLAISEKMKAQIKGLETASANSQDGISLIQTAEGALTEVHDMLNRMVELAEKSANGTIQDEVDRENIQNEVNALLSEIDRIGDSTNFNGINLIDGNLSGTAAGGAVTSPGGNPDAEVVNVKASVASAPGAVSGAQTKASSNTSQIGVAAALATNTVTINYKNQNGENKTVDITLSAGANLAQTKENLGKVFANAVNGLQEDGTTPLTDEKLK